MAFVQQKNSVLADRRFTRHVVELDRQKKAFAATLTSELATRIGRAIAFTDVMVEKAMRSFERRFKRHYGLSGSWFKVNTNLDSRECTRRRRQIAKGMLREANGLVRATSAKTSVND